MGIASGTVNWNSGGFCKFSVTFCVDNENAGSRSLRGDGGGCGRRLFHSEKRCALARRTRAENFLDGKNPAPRGILRGKNARGRFCAMRSVEKFCADSRDAPIWKTRLEPPRHQERRVLQSRGEDAGDLSLGSK
jgi:hypothetical protein